MANTSLSDEIGLFTGIPNEFIETAHDLSDAARWLFVLLRFYTHREKKCAFPSYKEIRGKTGWSYTTIAKAVKELEVSGWMARKKQFSRSTRYTLKRPSPADCHSYTNCNTDQSYTPASTTENVAQSYTNCNRSATAGVAYQDRSTKTECVENPVSPAKTEEPKQSHTQEGKGKKNSRDSLIAELSKPETTELTAAVLDACGLPWKLEHLRESRLAQVQTAVEVAIDLKATPDEVRACGRYIKSKHPNDPNFQVQPQFLAEDLRGYLDEHRPKIQATRPKRPTTPGPLRCTRCVDTEGYYYDGRAERIVCNHDGFAYATPKDRATPEQIQEVKEEVAREMAASRRKRIEETQEVPF